MNPLRPTAVESLLVRSRGATGLPWAAMSPFDTFYLVKACTASVTKLFQKPLSINSSLSGDKNPVGICTRLGDIRKNRTKHTKLSINWVYEFDEYTSGIIRHCSSLNHSTPPIVCAYVRDGQDRDATGDWIAIAATLPKLVETVVLWQYASWKLSVASTMSWIFFLLAAVMLQALGVSRESKKTSSNSRLNDIYVGDFLTVDGLGNEGKIILGVPVNVRTHVAWVLAWGIGGIVSFSSAIATAVILSLGGAMQFYLWGIFQCLWLISRSAFLHFHVPTDDTRPHIVFEPHVADQEFRLLSLGTGISRHLSQRHPRALEAYLQDLHDPFDIQSYMCSVQCRLDWESRLIDHKSPDYEQLASNSEHFVGIDIFAVLGDTMLTSIAWIHGCNMAGLDLYDSCLVLFKINKQQFFVPACRVLSGNASQLKKPLAYAEPVGAPRFIPKRGPCRGEDNGWVYWIPLGLDQWLYTVCSLDSLGEQRAEILDSAEVARRLKLGNLWVSLEDVSGVKNMVENAAILGRILRNNLLQEKKNS